MINKKLRILLTILLYFILVGFLVYFVLNHQKEILQQLRQVEWRYGTTIILLQIPIIALGGLTFHFLAQLFKISQHFRDWFGLSFIANLLNQLLPYRPGLLFRYFYLRKHYQMKTSEYLITTITMMIILLMTGSLFTLWGWLLGSALKDFYLFPILTLLLFILLTGLIYWAQKRRDNLMSRTLIHEWRNRFSEFLARPFILVSSIFTVLLLNLITAFVFYLLFMSVHSPISFNDAVFIAGVLGIALLFPITPGNIGILETLAGILTLNSYQDFSLGFTVVALYRATQWVPSIVLGTGFSLWLFGRLLPEYKNQSQLNL